MEMWTCHSQAPYQGNHPIPWIHSHGHCLRACPTVNRTHKNWWRGTRAPSANRDHWTHAHRMDASSVGEGGSPSTHNVETTPPAWEIQAQSEIMGNLWPRFQELCKLQGQFVLPTEWVNNMWLSLTCWSTKGNNIVLKPLLHSWYSQVSQRSLQTLCKLSPAVRQLSNGKLNLHEVDFYIWMKMISPKEDTSVFKQQFWHIFTVPDWFDTLTNPKFHKDGCVNGCMCLCGLKKCPPLEYGIKQSELACWLGEKAGLTSELAKQVIELSAEWHVEYTCKGTTWNKVSRTKFN